MGQCYGHSVRFAHYTVNSTFNAHKLAGIFACTLHLAVLKSTERKREKAGTCRQDLSNFKAFSSTHADTGKMNLGSPFFMGIFRCRIFFLFCFRNFVYGGREEEEGKERGREGGT